MNSDSDSRLLRLKHHENQRPEQVTYTVSRQHITWIHPLNSRGQQYITHPMQWVVTEHPSGDDVKVCNTKREAKVWITSQEEGTA